MAHAKPNPMPQPIVVPMPVGRPASLGVKAFNTGQDWMAAALEEVQHASRVDVATFLFDDELFTQKLLCRLRSRSPFACQIVVDKSAYDQRTSRFQRPRLLELQSHGASVLVSQGFDGRSLFGLAGRRGIMHIKAVIIDSRVAYTGTANITKSSRVNRELVHRIVGPPVSDILEAVLSAAACGQGPIL